MHINRHLDKIHLSEPYVRAITSALSIIEEMLNEMEALITSKGIPSLFTEIKNTLSADAKKRAFAKISEMKARISNIKETLTLPETSIRNTTLILSRNGKIWELLCDLQTKRLKSYGKTPEGLVDFLDPIIAELISATEEIPEILKARTRK